MHVFINKDCSSHKLHREYLKDSKMARLHFLGISYIAFAFYLIRLSGTSATTDEERKASHFSHYLAT